VPESTPAGFCVFRPDLDPEPESKFCEKPDPVSSEISDLLFFGCYFASPIKETKFGNHIFMCVV